MLLFTLCLLCLASTTTTAKQGEVTEQPCPAATLATPVPEPKPPKVRRHHIYHQESILTALLSVWTTLITNTAYLSGLLTLEYSLRRVQSIYPLLVLYTDSFPSHGHAVLDARGITKRHVPYLLPSIPKEFTNDVRFYDCWSKLTPFSLTEYERVVQLDSDMLILRNMDELMDIELDPSCMAGEGTRVFAASHACVCNPARKAHYPDDWYVLLPASKVHKEKFEYTFCILYRVLTDSFPCNHLKPE